MVEEVKKILVTGTTFPRWKGDTEPSFVYDLSELLAKRGYEVIALVPHHKGAKKLEIMGKVKIVRFPYFFERLEKLCYDGGMIPNMKKYWYARFLMPLLIISEMFYVFKIARKVKVDAIHAHWIVPQGFVAAIVKKFTGIPYIVTAHAGDVFPLKNKFLRWFGKVALKNCYYCTVNSNATKQAVINVEKISNIDIIPMGVDLLAFSESKKSSALRKKYGIKGQFIFTVEILAKTKNYADKGVKFIIPLPEPKIVS